MSDDELRKRIVCDSTRMTGKPVIRGTRLTVDFILNLLAHGSSVEEILDEYHGLRREDIEYSGPHAADWLRHAGHVVFSAPRRSVPVVPCVPEHSDGARPPVRPPAAWLLLRAVQGTGGRSSWFSSF